MNLTSVGLRPLPFPEATDRAMSSHTGSAAPRERVAGIRRRLLRQARLFDDPRAYSAGVLDALEALTRRGPASRRDVRHGGSSAGRPLPPEPVGHPTPPAERSDP